MDMKSAFLNGFLNKEVFVEQPKGFQDPHFPDHVFRLKKALYGLKQAPRAWYDRLTSYLLDHGFKRGQADRTLFVKREEKSLLVAQVYVDDIVFGSTINHLAHEFSEEMKREFEMSMVGDWAECIDDRKSTSGGCFDLGNNLVLWMSKKQNPVSLSMAEAEYIAVASCCAQLLWVKKLLHDYGITQDTMCVFSDNTSAINMSKNPVQYSKSKHIEIRYHFIRDLVEEKTVYLEFINTDN